MVAIILGKIMDIVKSIFGGGTNTKKTSKIKGSVVIGTNINTDNEKALVKDNDKKN